MSKNTAYIRVIGDPSVGIPHGYFQIEDILDHIEERDPDRWDMVDTVRMNLRKCFEKIFHGKISIQFGFELPDGPESIGFHMEHAP